MMPHSSQTTSRRGYVVVRYLGVEPSLSCIPSKQITVFLVPDMGCLRGACKSLSTAAPRAVRQLSPENYCLGTQFPGLRSPLYLSYTPLSGSDGIRYPHPDPYRSVTEHLSEYQESNLGTLAPKASALPLGY